MKILINEQLSPHKFKTTEGYLICTDAILARTGKQTYRRGEVFGSDCVDSETEVEIDRPAEEVFSEKTLASFENKPITVEHPDEDVNSSNWKDYQVGFVRDVKRGKTRLGEDVILGTLVIQDADTIEEILNGEHTELSCGYDCDIIDEKNPRQRNIRGNHVALCQQGRAGIAKIVDSNTVNDDGKSVLEVDYDDLKDWFGKEYDETIPKKFPDLKVHFQGYFGKIKIIGNKNSLLKLVKYMDLPKNYFKIIDSIKDDVVPDVTVQCYIFNGNKILIQDRVGPVWKGLAVPGGHVEEDESFEQACIREVKEETGLDVEDLERIGVEVYKCGGGNGVAILYKTHSFNGILRDSKEGKMMWMDIEEVLNSNKTAEGFKDLLKRSYKSSNVVDSIKDDDLSQLKALRKREKEIEQYIEKYGFEKSMSLKTEYDRIRKEIARLVEKIDGKNAIYGRGILSKLDSVKDKLVDIPQDIINYFENELTKRSIHIDGKGKTISGRKHYQVSSDIPWSHFKFYLESMDRYLSSKGIPMTFSASLVNGRCTAGIDLDSMYIEDSLKDAGIHQEQLAQQEYDNLKKQINELNEEIDENDNNPRYNKHRTLMKINEVIKKIEQLKKNFDYALDDCSKMKDASYSIKTKQGYDIIEMWRDGGRIHIIFRRANDYGIGLGYDSLSGTWAQGIYNLPTLQVAKNVLKEEKPNARQIQDSTKTYEVSYKDSKGNQIIELIDASSMIEAVKKISNRR